MLRAAKDAISQLGDLSSMIDDATLASDGDSAGDGAGVESAGGATVGGAPGASRLDASGAKPVELPAFDAQLSPQQAHALDLLSDVHLNVKIELGRTRMLVEDVLRLSEGAVVELDKLAGDPVDVYVNDRHVARGEVLVLNDNFCVRINEIVTAPADATDAVR
jgi:flagellar motor switch protein FliN/FliY